VDRIGVRRPSLDDVFLNLTGHQAEDQPVPGAPADQADQDDQEDGEAA